MTVLKISLVSTTVLIIKLLVIDSSNIAPQGKFPFFAIIHTHIEYPYNFETRVFESYCGGAAIKRKFVITAASCILSSQLPERAVSEYKRYLEPDVLKVYFGGTSFKYSFSDHMDRACGKNTVVDKWSIKPYLVRGSHIHPQWNRSSSDMEYNIALIELNDQVPATIELVEESKKNTFKGDCFVPGFGCIQGGEDGGRCLNDQLLYGQAPIIPCKEDRQTQICVFSRLSICRGDIGSPLMCRTSSGKNDVYVLRGLVSHQDKTQGTKTMRYHYLTDVTKFYKWINETSFYHDYFFYLFQRYRPQRC